MHLISSNIFRKYDIRGVYRQDLTDDVVLKIGFAFGKKTLASENKTVFIGYDGRLSSLYIFKNLVNGLKIAGIEPVSIGLCHSPMLYYICSQNPGSSGIMITGSHNPKEYNGMKIILNGSVFYDQEIQNLMQDVINFDESLKNKKINEITKSINIKSGYIERILKDINLEEINLKIVFDSANGATGNTVKKISEKFKNSTAIFTEIDGNFPNHHPDPAHFENLKSLIKKVKNKNANIGMMFDGDGDRVGFIDELGNPLEAEEMIAIFATNLKKNISKNKTIILDIKCSNYLVKFLEERGFNVIVSPTGHPYMKKAIKENNALFAAELSGHVFFNDDYFGFDDGVYSGIRMIEILAKSGKKLSGLRKIYPKIFSTPEISINCDDLKKFTIIEEIKKELRAKNISFKDIDGVKFSDERGSWLIRASNTTPKIIFVVNAKNENDLQTLILEAKELTFNNI